MNNFNLMLHIDSPGSETHNPSLAIHTGTTTGTNNILPEDIAMPTFPGYMRTTTLAGICLLAGFCQMAGAQPNADSNQRPDNIGTGPYPAMKEQAASLPDHVIYRPQNLSAMGSEKLGLVAWGNGGCFVDGASARFHLLELASHGYLVIANGNIYSGPGATKQAPVPEGQQPPRTVPEDLITAIDWAMAENARRGSPYYGRIDENQIAVSGYSCGGLEALQVAGDPRVDTVVLQNTGVLIGSDGTGLAAMNATKDQLDDIHTSIIYILGGEPDIAYVNGMDDYAHINHVPAAVANLPVGHTGTYNEENGGEAAQVAVHWLQWQLRGDREAAKWFIGANCKLCVDDKWTLETKGF
jgi:hypothetical protein